MLTCFVHFLTKTVHFDRSLFLSSSFRCLFANSAGEGLSSSDAAVLATTDSDTSKLKLSTSSQLQQDTPVPVLENEISLKDENNGMLFCLNEKCFLCDVCFMLCDMSC